ncbi:MAG: (2Fe-2S)-binding protein [Ignavibacteria bacterium]|nr:(2Fe-2S)-binding protein [Ignavibacteria bacterium]
MKIDKCICSNITFSEVKEKAMNENVKDIDGLLETIEVAKNCKLCLPYLNEMLKTGQTEFSNLILEKQ